MTSYECLSFNDCVDTKHNTLRPKRGLIQWHLLLHMLKIFVHCMGLRGLTLATSSAVFTAFTRIESTRLFFQASISSLRISWGSDSSSVFTRRQTFWVTATGTVSQVYFLFRVGHRIVVTISSVLKIHFQFWLIHAKIGSPASPS